MLIIKKKDAELRKQWNREMEEYRKAYDKATKHKVEISIVKFPDGGLELLLEAKERGGEVSSVLYKDRDGRSSEDLAYHLIRMNIDNIVKELEQLRAASASVKPKNISDLVRDGKIQPSNTHNSTR